MVIFDMAGDGKVKSESRVIQVRGGVSLRTLVSWGNR